MKARYISKSGKMHFEFDAQSVKEVFRTIAELQSVFEADIQCGCCQSNNLQFRVRTTKDNDTFYEMICEDCDAALTYGQKKDGTTIYPRRRDDQGSMLEDGGWKVWRPAAAERSHV